MDSKGKRKQFFDIEKAYDKVNIDKTLEQLENMGIQGSMLSFIREMVGERWIRLGNSTGKSV